MNKKITIGIIALLIIGACVLTTNAIPNGKNTIKPHKFVEGERDAWTVSNMQTLVSIKAEEWHDAGERVVNEQVIGTLYVKFYLTHDNGNELITTLDRPNGWDYMPDIIDPDNNNAIKVKAIQDKALEKYGMMPTASNVRYFKKTPGNQVN